MSKTIQQKANFDGFPKAKEVIELTGAGTGHLTMHDRRTLNLLYEHAHNTAGLTPDIEHEIALSAIRGTHKGAERVRDSLHRLMSVIVEINTTIDGKKKVIKTHLFDFTESDFDESGRDAVVRYGLPKKLRTVLKDSSTWGRIKGEIILAMSSKYAIALYEMVQVRCHLEHKWQENFDLQNFRELMGVPDGKVTRSPEMIRQVVKPAILEVNGLSDYSVALDPIRHGGGPRGKLLGFRMSWWKKTAAEYREALKERKRSKIGRMARLKGEVEEIDFQINKLS